MLAMVRYKDEENTVRYKDIQVDFLPSKDDVVYLGDLELTVTRRYFDDKDSSDGRLIPVLLCK